MFIIKQYPEELDIPYNLLLEADPSKKLVDKYLSRGILYGAFYNKTLIGECLLVFNNKTTAEIINLAVSKQYQNQSVGKTLISMTENQAKLFGYEYMEIGTAEPLVKYYEKLGYNYKGMIENFFIKNYNIPVIDNGLILKDMIRLIKKL